MNPLNTFTAEEHQVIAEAKAILYRASEQRPELTSPHAAGLLFSSHLFAKDNEEFVVAYLDTRHRLIVLETAFTGTIDGATVHPRVIAKRALELNAAACLISHQHPSGEPEPSRQDVALTRRLGQALALIDVRLLDHFVCAPGAEPVSLAERGLYQCPTSS